MSDAALYRGRIDQMADRKLTSIRIFISSTFTDTTEERNLLIRCVYPKLKEYCLRTYNIQFQYSDMRWGIQEKAADDHSTTDMCLYELDQCCRYSLCTNCVILLSHRYGGRMLPANISKYLLDRLLAVLPDSDRALITDQYQLDENPLEPVYILRPIDSTQKKAWKESEQKLKVILRRASDLCFQENKISEDERNEFHISVTAKEIHHALMRNENRPERMVAFFRDIEDFDQFQSDLKAKFTDDNDEMTEKLLNDTKAIIRDKLPADKIFDYKVQWMNESSRTKYLAKFEEDFFLLIKQQIDYHLAQIRVTDVLYDEIFEHSIQCKLLHERCFTRNDILEKIKSFLSSDNNNSPLIIYGKSGTGKSSITADAVVKVPQWFGNAESIAVVIRFLGTTPLSSDIRRPMISMIRQICRIYQITMNISDESSIPLQQLKRCLEKLLQKIPSNEKLVLVFDSIDQLQVEYYDCSQWLPSRYPSNVKCILSTIPIITENDVEYKILDGLKSFLGDISTIEITILDELTAMNVFQSWLERDRRCLTPIQMEWIRPKLIPNTEFIEDQPTPLFLSLLYDITLSWHSFDDKPDPDFIEKKSTGGAIRYLYSQLSKKHGELIFLRSMAYLRQTGGLNDTEMEDMLSADNEVLQSIFVHYLPPLSIFRLPSSLWIRIRNDMSKYLIEKNVDNTPVTYFYHRAFRKPALTTGNQNEQVERIRRAYFAGPVGKIPNLHSLKQMKSSESIVKNLSYGWASLLWI